MCSTNDLFHLQWDKGETVMEVEFIRMLLQGATSRAQTWRQGCSQLEKQKNSGWINGRNREIEAIEKGKWGQRDVQTGQAGGQGDSENPSILHV